jgi:Fic family protein
MGKIGTQGQNGSSFIPRSFPPNELIKWNNNLISLLSKADMAIGKLNAIDQLVPDVDYFIFMYIRKEAALSSQIEGTQATLLDLVKAEAKLENEKPPSDLDEIINYIKAMNYGIKKMEELPLSLRLIKEVHKELLKGVRGENRYPGEFRRIQNWIGGRTIETAAFIPPKVPEMQKALNDLERFMHEEKESLPPLIKTALIHAQFETIHPFLDGNGRTGRLLITFYLYKEGILSRPLLYLSDYFNRYRNHYYEKLNSYRFGMGVEEWLKFFLDGVRVVAEEATETAIKITKLKEKDTEKVSGFGKNAEKALKLLNKLYSLPIVDSKLISKITGITSRTNTNSLIEKFIKAGILREITGKERNKRYIYSEYIKQFSKEKI